MTTRIAILSVGVLLAASQAAQAGPSEAMAFAIGQCSSQPDERARLACYDQIAAQLKAGSFVAAAPQVAPQNPASPPPFVQLPTPGAAVAPAPAPVAQPPAAVAQAPRQESGSWYDPTSWFGKDEPQATSNKPADFGAEHLPQTRTASAEPERLNEMRANVRAVAYNPNGKFTVTLDNGQVWRQLDADTGSARFKKTGDVVIISRGVLGSYNLVVDGRNSLFKVKRLK